MQALYQWQMSQNPLQQIEQQFRSEFDFSQVDLEFFQELLHHIPAQVGELDALFAPYLDRTVKELTPIELALLRMGTYELAHRIDVPFKATVLRDGHQILERTLKSVTFNTAVDDKIFQQPLQ